MARRPRLHVIDHVRTALGEIRAVEGSLQTISPQGWTAEDTYSVRLFTESGAEALLQSSAADLGPFAAMERVAGTSGALWAEGGTVAVADADGTRPVAVPPELEVLPPSPPPADLMHTTYDLLHSTGMDFGPWVRMAETFRDLVIGRPVPAVPPPATFDDGVALMAVMDAIRESARRRAVVDVVDHG
jgi:predicted dehydrogenase